MEGRAIQPMNWITEQRLINQRFADDSFANGAQVVTWFCAIQGQEYAQTKWSIGLRAPRLTDLEVERQLNRGQILRTHLLRPTWHFVSAKDIRWLLKLTAPSVHQRSAYMYRQEDLDRKVFSKCNKILTRLLRDRNFLTRDKINEEFARCSVHASGPRLSYIMMNAELEGLICSGPRIGRQLTYALLDERADPMKELTRDESLGILTSRYFTSRGPATVNDFATWSGLKISDCKKGIGSVRSELLEEKFGGRTYVFATKQKKPREIPRMMMLPIYDEYIMGYKDRSAIMEKRDQYSPIRKLRFPGTVIWDGQIIGTWRRIVNNGTLKTEFDYFKPLNKEQKFAFGLAYRRLEEFSQVKMADGAKDH
jgi:hypothetical protein